MPSWRLAKRCQEKTVVRGLAEVVFGTEMLVVVEGICAYKLLDQFWLLGLKWPPIQPDSRFEPWHLCNRS